MGLGWVMGEELSISEPLSLEFSSDASTCKTGFLQSVHLEFVFCSLSGYQLGHLYLRSGEATWVNRGCTLLS